MYKVPLAIAACLLAAAGTAFAQQQTPAEKGMVPPAQGPTDSGATRPPAPPAGNLPPPAQPPKKDVYPSAPKAPSDHSAPPPKN
jgi:hypothetical protein